MMELLLDAWGEYLIFLNFGYIACVDQLLMNCNIQLFTEVEVNGGGYLLSHNQRATLFVAIYRQKPFCFSSACRR